MALPTVADLRDYLRIETTVEDSLLERLLAQAKASVEAYIRQPIEARAQAFVVSPQHDALGGGLYGYVSRLVLPMPFEAGSVSVVDADGADVSGSDYAAFPSAGRLTAVSGASFTVGAAYTVTARVGLSLRSDYTEAVEPALSSAIIDWAADLYQRRNPAASYESGGGGVAVNYNETASKTMPSRIRVTLDPWRRVLV